MQKNIVVFSQCQLLNTVSDTEKIKFIAVYLHCDNESIWIFDILLNTICMVGASKKLS